MFERYTEKARRVIFFARYEASTFGSPYIETEHVLLGILREDKALGRFFQADGAAESIRKQVESRTTVREKISTSVDLPLSNECKRVLAYAAEEAGLFSHPHIGTEHLLLGLLREEKCFAAEMLHGRGLQLPKLREELKQMIGENAQRRERILRSEYSRELATLATEQRITAIFLDVSCRRLGEMTKYLVECVKKLSDEQVWRRQGAYENAVGNLILHLCGNARQWIVHGVGGAEDVRVRDKEFSADRGMTGTELISLFESTMDEAKRVIAMVPEERMTERIHPQGRDASVLEAIYQVVGHVQQHTGQIILLTKQMLATDLDLTMPRPR
ncbi:MAG TPA: Clp protease N-terminal domain-containing protein [Edaphobacter sp.]|nr:Clp protease N-terminal domain-containing protein [Edaphobacter sp.]